jgi:hypothetical protein
MTPNKVLQLTANPLRGLSAAELGRQAAGKGIDGNESAHQHDNTGRSRPCGIGEIL